MRERLDCAMFSTTCSDDWAARWVGTQAGGRLHIVAPAPHLDVSNSSSSQVLVQWAMGLRRFDVCLLAISEQNLAWSRTALLAAQGRLQTPIFGLVRQLKARALNDLYALGMVDFVRDPLCVEELRMRIERLLDERRYRPSVGVEPYSDRYSVTETDRSYDDGDVFQQAEADLCSTILERTGRELDAFAAASASRSASSKESFKAAKSKVIARFETAYIKAALGRHAGNIAMAARAAQKHRRAFWALMRKYDIDAAPYRAGATAHSGLHVNSSHTGSAPKLHPPG